WTQKLLTWEPAADLQLLHLQQIIAKLESRFEKLIDRKRFMEQNFQRTARTQQAH
ncbi:hypothetical protein F442_14545, partial [Phytophthora nicotianae P10297]